MRTRFLRRSISGLTLALVASGLVAACRGADDGAATTEGAATAADKAALLDVDDVSILFSLGADGTPFPSYALTGDPAVGDLLPSRTIDQVISAAKGQNPPIQFKLGGDRASGWRVFGMRFDPCAPGIKSTGPAGVNGDRSKCQVQVRLIAQPVGQRAPQDITMHVVYTIGQLPSVDLEQMRADLVAIKQASAQAGAPTAGQPLGVHPGLAKRDGATRAALTAFLKKYVPQQKQTAIAFMGLQNDGAEPWQFFAGAVVPILGFANLADIPGVGMPALPRGTKSIVFQPFASPVVSPTPQTLSTAPLFGGNDDSGSLAFQVENPSTNHFFNTDCVSCHTSTQLTVGFQTKSNTRRARVPAGITGYVSPAAHQNGTWNLRNFGYFSTSPSVSHRTVTETVDVVELMNEGHRSTDPRAAGFAGPGNDCTAVDDAVFDCFLTNADGKNGSTCMTANHCNPFPLDQVTPPPNVTPTPLEPLPDPATDPCLAGPEQSGLTIKLNTITITGKATECFSRSFSAFKIHNPDPGDHNDDSVSIICNAGASCFTNVSSLAEPTVIHGRDAERLTFLLGKVSPDHTFVAHTKDGDLSFACSGDGCTITPPPGANLIPQ